MKKLILLGFILFFSFKGFSQCGVVSGFQPQENSSNIGSTLEADLDLTPGWNVYSLQWEYNGSPAGTTNSIINNGVLFDDVCLTAKATNPSTGDSCESKYCQLMFTMHPSSFGLYIEAVPAGPKTMQIYGRVATTYTQPAFSVEIDYGDGMIEPVNFATHVYADTGTYEVKFTYTPAFGLPEFVKRKIYVDNGHTNFSLASFAGTNTCFIANTAFTSNPPFFYGWAEPTLYSPLCITNYLPINPGVSFAMPYRGTGIDILNCIASDSLGNEIRISKLVAIPDCKIAPDTMSGTIWLDADADGLWDSNENPFTGSVDVKFNLGSYVAEPDVNGNYSIPVPQVNDAVYLTNLSSNYLVTFPGGSGHISNFNTSTNHPGYHFGVANTGVDICGRAYIDINSNGVFDSGTDLAYSGVLVRAYNAVLNKTFSASCDQGGYYCMAVPVGNYVLKTISNNLDSAYAVPDSIIVNAPTAGNYNNNDFGFQTPVQGGNLGIFLSAGGMPRPGFDYSLGSTVTNSGIDASSGTVVLNYSPALIYGNSTTGGVHNASLKTVTWQTGVMAPTTSKYYSANFTVPISTPLGTNLFSSSTIATGATYTDYYLPNNSSSVNSIVIGSFDPNDKLVTPPGIGAGANVLHSQRMYYRINFQNTGTAEAINIIVQDEIDPNLDMNTFRMERASDTYSMVISGNTITWRFFNIMLPDSNSNEPGSHGFIEFSIKAIQGLPDGTVIANDADIYFDFNPPIITNTVSNTLQTTLTGISEYSMESDINVFPNPVNNILNIHVGNSVSGKKVITIFNKLGENVYKVVTYENQIEIPMNVSPGVYSIEVRSKSGNYTKRVLKL